MVQKHRSEKGLHQPLFNHSMDGTLLEFRVSRPGGALYSDSSSVDSFVNSPDSDDLAGGSAPFGGHPGRPPRRTNLSAAALSGGHSGRPSRRTSLPAASTGGGHNGRPPHRGNLSVLPHSAMAQIPVSAPSVGSSPRTRSMATGSSASSPTDSLPFPGSTSGSQQPS